MSEAPESSPESPPTLPTPAPGPVSESHRIDAIDAVRGFALLGIFLVNIHFFAMPVGTVMTPRPHADSSTSDSIAFYSVKVLCEGKFYPLFSLLFGMGLALQYGRAMESGRRFVGIGIRRLFVLLLIGAAHALLVWYGDILFMYALAGMVLLIFLRAQPSTLFVLAGAWLYLAVVISCGVFAIMMIISDKPAAEVPKLEAVEPTPNPFGDFIDDVEKKEGKADPADRAWINNEMRAYRYGPYWSLFMFRAMTWAAIITFSAFSFGWEILAMMFLGAGLLKAGLFAPEQARWFRRMFWFGILAGLPLAICGALAPRLVAGPGGQAIGAVVLMIGGPVLSLGYLGGIAHLVSAGRARFLTRALANTGRMALTNYLTQSLIATTIFYYYGFGLFGQTTAAQRVGMVVAIYIAQVAFSSFWMRHFQFGPMEWLWRTLTYLRLQPLVRKA